MTIPDSLLAAYSETHYHVYSTPEIILRPDIHSVDLANLHQRYGVKSSAVITAWNPYSEQLSDADNAKRQSQLMESLSDTGLQTIEALGKHPTSDWPGEKSIFILGISLSDVSTLGYDFEQNALIFSSADAVPRVIRLDQNRGVE